jgi:DNA-binding beta-propeller fold protein YncE
MIVPAGTLGIRSPEAIAFDHRGLLILADTGNHRVLIISPDGKVREDFGSYGWTDGRMDGPTDLCVYQGFYIYVLDEGNRRVLRYDLDGNYLDELIDESRTGTPVAMALAKVGGLLLVDSDSQSVLVYSQFDEALEPVGEFGLGEGGLIAPTEVAVGPSREIAVADPGRNAVLVFDEFGSPLRSLSVPDTLYPVDVAVGSEGDVIVADGRHDRVLLFPPAPGRSRPVELATGFSPTALALTNDGEIAVLDGESGAVSLIRIVYDTDPPERR